MSDASPIRVALREDDTLLDVVLDQPKGNVLSTRMLEAMERAISKHRDLRQLRLVVLRGAGGNFSFGASVPEHQREQAHRMLTTFHRFARMLARNPVPVAVLVEGRCLGGAFELALCAHFLFATPDAVFACPEIKLGVFPPVLAAIGPLRLPSMVAERLLLTGDEIDATTAALCGMLTSVLPQGRDPMEVLLEWYRAKLRPLSAYSLRQATAAARARSPVVQALAEPLAHLEAHYLAKLLDSHDGNEGIAAFLERRKPDWKDA